MNALTLVIIGIAAGAVPAWIVATLRMQVRQKELEIRLEQERKTSLEKIGLLTSAQENLSGAFKALSAEALQHNNQSFLDLAKASLEKYQEIARADLDKRQVAINEMVKPVKESLTKVDEKIQLLEQARTGAYEALKMQIQSLSETQKELRLETANLGKALRQPAARGRWGEIQLRRVVEMAGMLNHCDFTEQKSMTTEDGRLRPDLVVQLPGGKNIVVDAKVPLAAYLEAIETGDDAVRLQKLKDHAQQVRTHLTQLGRKSYWENLQPTPEFVVLFLPGEAFFSSALQQDPGLIEVGVSENVILATPTTLIALLRAVQYGWRQESLAENAKKISALGLELYNRLATLGEHFAKMGKSLRQAVESYNDMAGSLETRVLSSARKFRDFDNSPSHEALPQLTSVDSTPRNLQAEEFAKPRVITKE